MDDYHCIFCLSIAGDEKFVGEISEMLFVLACSLYVTNERRMNFHPDNCEGEIYTDRKRLDVDDISGMLFHAEIFHKGGGIDVDFLVSDSDLNMAMEKTKMAAELVKEIKRHSDRMAINAQLN